MSAGWFATTLKPLNLSANNDIGATVVTAESDEIADYNKYLNEVMGGLDEINVVVQDEDIVVGGSENPDDEYSIFDDVVSGKNKVTIITGAGELLDNASASTVRNDIREVFENAATPEYSDEFAEFITTDRTVGGVDLPDQAGVDLAGQSNINIDGALDKTLDDHSDDEFDQYLSMIN